MLQVFDETQRVLNNYYQEQWDCNISRIIANTPDAATGLGSFSPGKKKPSRFMDCIRFIIETDIPGRFCQHLAGSTNSQGEGKL